MSGVQDVIVEADPEEERPTTQQGAVVEESAPDGEKLPEGVTAIEGGYRIALRYPVTLRFKSAEKTREERFPHLDVRRLNGGDLRAMLGDERPDGAMMLLERILQVADSRKELIIDRMDAVDVNRAMEFVAFLSGASRKTGR